MTDDTQETSRIDAIEHELGRVSTLLEMVLSHMQIEQNAEAGIPVLQPKDVARMSNGTRVVVDLPTGLGELFVTIPVEGDGFDVTWRSPDKIRVVHTFPYADGMRGDHRGTRPPVERAPKMSVHERRAIARDISDELARKHRKRPER